MARTSNNIASNDLIEALKIEGYTPKAARKVVALAKRVSELGPNQSIVRASELTEENVGQLLKIGNGETRVINDVEETPAGRSMQWGVRRAMPVCDGVEMEFDGDDNTELRASYARGRTKTVVLESKLVKIPADQLVVITEPNAG